MVGHSYSHTVEIKRFLACWSPCEYMQKNKVIRQKKVGIYVFIFIDVRSFFFSIPKSGIFHKSPIVWKFGGARLASRRTLTWSGYTLYTPSQWREFFCEVILARQFTTPDEIARRVPGAWVLSFQMYFNCSPFP